MTDLEAIGDVYSPNSSSDGEPTAPVVVSELIKQRLQWKSVIILYESATGNYLSTAEILSNVCGWNHRHAFKKLVGRAFWG